MRPRPLITEFVYSPFKSSSVYSFSGVRAVRSNVAYKLMRIWRGGQPINNVKSIVERGLTPIPAMSGFE